MRRRPWLNRHFTLDAGWRRSLPAFPRAWFWSLVILRRHGAALAPSLRRRRQPLPWSAHRRRFCPRTMEISSDSGERRRSCFNGVRHASSCTNLIQPPSWPESPIDLQAKSKARFLSVWAIAFNVFNHAWLNYPTATVAGGTFGYITSFGPPYSPTQGARSLQFSGPFNF